MTNPLVLAATYNKAAIKVRDGDRVDPDFLTREHAKIESALKFATSFTGTVFNALDYGADPTGARDATDALNRAAREAEDGLLLLPPGATFKLSEPLVIENPLAVQMIGATLNQTGATQSGLYVRSSGVTVLGGTVQGPQYAAFDDDAIGIRVEAPSWAEKYENVFIRGTRATRWGDIGILLQWVDGFDVDSVRVDACHYAGIMTIGSRAGKIHGRTVLSDFPGSADTSTNAYGVSLNRLNGASLTTDPLSQNIIVEGVVATDVPTWNGFDTHGGIDITFTGCHALRCDKGFWAVPASSGATETWAPKRVRFIGCTTDTASDDGDMGAGFVISGAASGVGAVVDYAEDCVIDNCTTMRHGNGNTTSAGVYVEFAKGVKIDGLLADRSSPNAITLNSDCEADITGSTFRDCWDDTNFGRGVRVQDDNVTAWIDGCSMVRGDKTATYVNTDAVCIVNGAASAAVSLGTNDWSGVSSVDTVRDLQGGAVTNIRTVTTTHAVAASDLTILGDATGGAFDVDLPPAQTSAGRILTVKKIDAGANAVTVDGDGAETIDGAGTFPLAAQWDSVTVQSNGTAWYVLATV